MRLVTCCRSTRRRVKPGALMREGRNRHPASPQGLALQPWTLRVIRAPAYPAPTGLHCLLPAPLTPLAFSQQSALQLSCLPRRERTFSVHVCIPVVPRENGLSKETMA